MDGRTLISLGVRWGGKPTEAIAGFEQRSGGIWLTLVTAWTIQTVEEEGRNGRPTGRLSQRSGKRARSPEPGGSAGNGEKCWNPGYILKMELIAFTL